MDFGSLENTEIVVWGSIKGFTNWVPLKWKCEDLWTMFGGYHGR